MATLLDYRRRIRSVKSTQQITRAMKFVAAAKLRRAQEGVFAARPYAREILRVLRSAAARIESTVHPLLERRAEERILTVTLTGDRSLAGAFNSNVIRRAMLFARENSSKKIQAIAIGKKGRDTLKKRGWVFVAEFLGVSTKVEFGTAKEIAAKITEMYSKGEVDAVYAVYNEFKNVIVQKLTVMKLLPIDPAVLAEGPGGSPGSWKPRRRGPAARPGGQRQIPGRLHLRRAGRADFQRVGAALPGSRSISHFAGVSSSGTRRPDDGNGFRYAECVGVDRFIDTGYEQDSPGGDYQGIDRDR